LRELVKSHELELWEPDLAITAIKTIYDAYLAAGPSHAEKAKDMAVRLALLSPEEALALAPLDLGP
jgi:hypothetical protein